MQQTHKKSAHLQVFLHRLQLLHVAGGSRHEMTQLILVLVLLLRRGCRHPSLRAARVRSGRAPLTVAAASLSGHVHKLQPETVTVSGQRLDLLLEGGQLVRHVLVLLRPRRQLQRLLRARVRPGPQLPALLVRLRQLPLQGGPQLREGGHLTREAGESGLELVRHHVLRRLKFLLVLLRAEQSSTEVAESGRGNYLVKPAGRSSGSPFGESGGRAGSIKKIGPPTWKVIYSR